MSGSALSMNISTFVGMRVSRTTYYPAHSKNGVNISQRLTITAGMNTPGRNGGEGKTDYINLTAWGKLADICAKSMSRGKEFHCTAEANTYMGRVFHNDQQLVASDGTAIMARRTSFTIRRLVFGEESNKFIADEIGAQLRPAGWNIPGSADQTKWREILNQRKMVQFDPNLGTFGYATVILPSGPGIGAFNPNAATNQAGNAPLTTQIENVVTNAAVNPVKVDSVFGQPGAQEAAPAGNTQTAAAPAVSQQGFMMPAGNTQTAAAPAVSQQGFMMPEGV